MSRSSACRGQTEPIAAIVAVSVLVIGIGIYAVYVQGAIPGTGDRATADATIDRVWEDVNRNGTVHAHGGADPLSTLVTADAIPTGSSVFVRVTAIDGGEQRSVASAAFPPGYPHETDRADAVALERYVDAEGVPADASDAARPVPVALVSSADVRSGTLEVYVW